MMPPRISSASRCCLALVSVQLVIYSVIILRLFRFKFGLSDESEKYSRVAVERNELYMNGELNLTETNNDNECVKSFLENYSKYCEAAIVPQSSVIGYHSNSIGSWWNKPLCPCLPKGLTGKVNVNFNSLKLPTDVFHGMLPGGHWTPSWCIPRQRIAIIIPFRDRASHLDTLLQVLHPFLQNQLHSYKIFVIEQTEPVVFNKASLMNSGFMEVVKNSNQTYDCFLFHDVDTLPQDDRNIYGCYKVPRHVAAYVDRLNYRLMYYRMFGGATAFTRKQFEASNGYSNKFYGWGGEDDDMEKRVVAANMTYIRFPSCVAKYTVIKHARDANNPRYSRAALGWQYRPHVYKVDGLNTLSYKLVSYEERLLYTRIAVSLPPPPTQPQVPLVALSTLHRASSMARSTSLPKS